MWAVVPGDATPQPVVLLGFQRACGLISILCCINSFQMSSAKVGAYCNRRSNPNYADISKLSLHWLGWTEVENNHSSTRLAVGNCLLCTTLLSISTQERFKQVSYLVYINFVTSARELHKICKLEAKIYSVLLVLDNTHALLCLE